MDNKRSILIAFDSKTMRAVIRKLLEESGYCVYESIDGMEALRLLFNIHPDLALIYLDLPVIGGFDLSRIIKTTPSLMDINVLICASENKVIYNFWRENSLCNDFYVIKENQHKELIDKINNLMPAITSVNIQDQEVSDKKIIETVTNSLNSNLYNLYTINNVFSNTKYINDINTIAMNLIRFLKSIFSYDAVGVIINDEPLLEYYDIKESLSDEDIIDFKNICHRDFESITKNYKSLSWQKSMAFTTRFEVTVDKGKLKTYEIFPLVPKEPYPLSIHLSTCRQDTLSDEIRDQLNFFTEAYSQLLTTSISFHKIISSNMRMRHAFGHFVPQQYIDSIITGDSNDSITIGQSRNIAILISDIRNFTNISEVNKPENVVAFLNKYFSVMCSIIRQNGGTIDKFMGDAIMALFGATDSYSDNAARAAKTAYEMMKVLPGIDVSMINIPEGFTFNIGIGVHYGEVIVGSIGSDEKQDFTVIGDNVNIASRIESLNKIYGTNIIITESVKEHLSEKYQIRLLDKVKVKGKSIITNALPLLLCVVVLLVYCDLPYMSQDFSAFKVFQNNLIFGFLGW